LCYAVGAFGFYEADNEAAQPGDIYGAMSCPNAAAVFVVVPINYVVATVFNAPMFAIGLKDFLGIRLLGRATGQPVNNFVTAFSRFFVNAFPLNNEGLADMREIQELVKYCGCPDFSGFDTAMIGRGIVDKIRFLPVLEEGAASI
jgi:hypothetical protein